MEWFYSKDQKQQGPVSQEDLSNMLKNKELPAETLVWREGQANWQPANQVAEFQGSLELSSAEPTSGTLTNPTTSTPQTASPMAPVPHEHIPNYLVWSILATIFCCWPFGIPSIVYAAKVDGLVARGMIEQARDASNKAKMWMFISIGAGLLVGVIYGIFAVAGGLAGATSP